MAPINAPELRGPDRVKTAKPIENCVVLASEIKKSRCDRERDHNGVDAGGADRERTREGSKSDRNDDANRHRGPPWPTKANGDHGTLTKDRDAVSGQPGDRHLDQGDHAAIAGKKHQAERDHAQNEAPPKYLSLDETVAKRR